LATFAGGVTGTCGFCFSPIYMKAMKIKKLKPRAIRALFSIVNSSRYGVPSPGVEGMAATQAFQAQR
jgi:hypothetical protein